MGFTSETLPPDASLMMKIVNAEMAKKLMTIEDLCAKQNKNIDIYPISAFEYILIGVISLNDADAVPDGKGCTRLVDERPSRVRTCEHQYSATLRAGRRCSSFVGSKNAFVYGTQGDSVQLPG